MIAAGKDNPTAEDSRLAYGHSPFREIGHNRDMRQVLVYRGEDGLWVAECPSLPGCVSQGVTPESALDNIKEAIAAYVGALEADHLPVPEEHFDARLVTV